MLSDVHDSVIILGGQQVRIACPPRFLPTLLPSTPYWHSSIRGSGVRLRLSLTTHPPVPYALFQQHCGVTPRSESTGDRAFPRDPIRAIPVFPTHRTSQSYHPDSSCPTEIRGPRSEVRGPDESLMLQPFQGVSQHGSVQDFDWPQGGESPNWSRLPERPSLVPGDLPPHPSTAPALTSTDNAGSPDSTSVTSAKGVETIIRNVLVLLGITKEGDEEGAQHVDTSK